MTLAYRSGQEPHLGDVVRGRTTRVASPIVGVACGLDPGHNESVQVMRQELRLAAEPWDPRWLVPAAAVHCGHDEQTGRTTLVRQVLEFARACDLELVQRADGTCPPSTAALVGGIAAGKGE